MKVTQMNDRMLISIYLKSKDKDNRDALIIELLHRGFINSIDGNETGFFGDDNERIVYPECDKKRKRICALCEKTPWCLDYEPGGLGTGLILIPISLYM